MGSWGIGVPRGMEREINNKYHGDKELGGMGYEWGGGCLMLICGTKGPAKCPPGWGPCPGILL